MLSISSQKGFSLVEVVIVGILAALMSGVVFVVLSSAQNQLVEAESGLRVQQISTEVVERIQQVGHNFGFATTDGNIETDCGLITGTGSSLVLVKEGDGPDCNDGTIGDRWSGFAVMDDSLLVEIIDPEMSWDAFQSEIASPPEGYGSWKPVEIAGYRIYVSNPTPFTSLGLGRNFLVDFGKLHLNSPAGDSIDIPPFKVRCQFRS